MATPAFVYGNALNKASSWSFSSITVTGQEADKAFDYRSDTTAQLRVLKTPGSYIEVTLSEAYDLSGFGVLYDTIDSDFGPISVALRYESSPGVFTELETIDCADEASGCEINSFTEVSVSSGDKLRIYFSTSSAPTNTDILIRQIIVGEFIQPELGQYAGLKFPALHGGYKNAGVKMANASSIGVDIKRTERMSNLNLEYMTQTFFRDTWQPFASHAVKYPFLYNPEWSSTDREGAFSFAESMTPPRHSGLEDRVNVNWTLRNRVAEEYVSS